MSSDRFPRPDRTIRTVVALVALAVALTVGAAPAAGQAAPEEVAFPLTGVTGLATGFAHSCAVTTAQQAVCWGANDVGQLGRGPIPGHTPSFVRNRAGTATLNGVVALAAGSVHTCALLTNHQVRCWGDDARGQLGNGPDVGSSPLPGPVRDPSGAGVLRDVAEISAAFTTTCARLSTGQVRCWGGDEVGQVGDGAPTANEQLPRVVRAVRGNGPLTGVAQVDVGDYHTCARLTTGQLRCWGEAGSGQLGDGTYVDRSRPGVVIDPTTGDPLGRVRQVAAGGAHTCAALTGGTARCWGENSSGQLGNGGYTTFSLATVVIARANTTRPLRDIASIDVGLAHTCARLTNGQVRCWGANDDDELANGVHLGMAIAVPSPVRNVENTGYLGDVVGLRTNSRHTCVRLDSGQVRCWGFGGGGALDGVGVDNQPLPIVVSAPGAG